MNFFNMLFSQMTVTTHTQKKPMIRWQVRSQGKDAVR